MSKLLLSGFFSLLACALVTQAAPLTELHHNQASELVTSGKILSLTDTLNIVTLYCNGKLIDVHLYQEVDKWRYDLQLKVRGGELINLSINAKDGRPIPEIPLPSECRQNETTAR